MERGWSSVSFGVLLIAALVAVPLSGSLLPAVVASHFGVHGEANGFMPRGSYLLLMTVFTWGCRCSWSGRSRGGHGVVRTA